MNVKFQIYLKGWARAKETKEIRDEEKEKEKPKRKKEDSNDSHGVRRWNPTEKREEDIMF